MPLVEYSDWGFMEYDKAWKKQSSLQTNLINLKRSGQQDCRSGLSGYLVFCTHPPVYTLGKSGTEENLLLSKEELDYRTITYRKINRGGDITYHGPGQIVGYPIFDLDCFFTDVHRYVRLIEEAVIRTVAAFGIEAGRVTEYTGVWVDADKPAKRKICAIGVHLSRWVTMHGFALNVNTDLQYFRHIVPCGIEDRDKEVSSMQKELGRTIDEREVKGELRNNFQDLFGFEWAQSNNAGTAGPGKKITK